MAQRSRDWMDQALRDLDRARLDVQYEYYEWACFVCQQAAEKAVKAVHYARNKSVRGHGILKLLQTLLDEEESADERSQLLHDARILDRYYIGSRYPNGFPTGKPADYFDLPLAVEALHAAEEIIGFCQHRVD
jgi:HEPN domain-containing protein